ncbi:MAG TPA: hypothetical protein VIS76_05800 [Pseudomonadales bacterium]
MLLPVAAVLSVAGCMIPIPSVPEEPPYQTTGSELVVGTTTRSEVVALLGEPPISRAAGRLTIYGASRETAARILGITIVPMTIPLEEFHFLFLEFDEADVLQSRELVVQPPNNTNPACDSRGRCLMRVEWEMTGAVPVWVSSGDVKHGDRAVVSASREQEALVRRMEPPESGCTIYLFDQDREPRWYDALAMKSVGSVYLALDDHPQYFGQRYPPLFAAWSVPPGQHVVQARRRDGTVIEQFPVECADGALLPVLAEILPTVAGVAPRVDFSLVATAQARQLIAGRRLVLE